MPGFIHRRSRSILAGLACGATVAALALVPSVIAAPAPAAVTLPPVALANSSWQCDDAYFNSSGIERVPTPHFCTQALADGLNFQGANIIVKMAKGTEWKGTVTVRAWVTSGDDFGRFVSTTTGPLTVGSAGLTRFIALGWDLPAKGAWKVVPNPAYGYPSWGAQQGTIHP